jgi:hypothetical protein
MLLALLIVAIIVCDPTAGESRLGDSVALSGESNAVLGPPRTKKITGSRLTRTKNSAA